jgi:hypothetical protein
MALTSSVSAAFSRIADDLAATSEGRHRQRRRRAALALVALLLAASLALLLLRVVGQTSSKVPVALPRLSSAVPKQGALRPKPTAGLPAVVCVGPHKTVARSPTNRDYKRLKRNAAKPKKRDGVGKAPKMPSEITGRRLPNGTFSGMCLYGGQSPAMISPGSSSNY